MANEFYLCPGCYAVGIRCKDNVLDWTPRDDSRSHSRAMDHIGRGYALVKGSCPSCDKTLLIESNAKARLEKKVKV